MHLEARELGRCHGRGPAARWVLRGVSRHFPAGSWTTVTGPSGSGKSTLLLLLAAIDRPSSGRVLADGLDVSHAPDVLQARYRKHDIGVLFQHFHLVEGMRALDNVALPLVTGELGPAARRRRAMELLDLLGLADRAAHFPRWLSGGERQRVALARALVGNPRVLFADEPTASIDSDTARQVLEVFHNFRRRGNTLVVVSHDPALRDGADSVLRLEGGEIRP